MLPPKIIKEKSLWSKYGKKFLELTYQAEDGYIFDWIKLDTPNSVVIVAETFDKKVVVVRQFRFNLNNYVNENPAGGIEVGEDNISAAKRELMEETGYESNDITFLGKYYLLPGETNRQVSFFLAKNAHKVSEKTLDSELEKYFDISVSLMPIEEAESKMTGVEHLFALQLAKKHL